MGPKLSIPFVDEHLEEAERVLEKMKRKGYFGPVGCDAMIYQKKGAEKLHPLVEINARQTMSGVLLAFQKKIFPKKSLRFEFSSQGKDKNTLLPKKIINTDEIEIKFNKQLYFEFNS